jgi:GNAT superfamily N-acetyltransferase
MHLCGPDDLDRLAGLATQFHAEMGRDLTDEARRAALAPLLAGSPHGAAYLFGPARAPTGYLVVSFGWSVEFGGLEARIDELFVREKVRGRGIGSEAVNAMSRALAGAGVMALHLEVDAGRPGIRKFYQQAGFVPRSDAALMSRAL